MFNTIFKIIYLISRKVIFFDHILYILFRCVIPRKACIGDNVTFNHAGLGTVVHPKTRIGDNVWIEHHVTLGQKNGAFREAPIIENDCVLGAYAVVLGGCVIGEGSVIGAGSIITSDIPPHSIVYNRRELVIRENDKPKGQY